MAKKTHKPTNRKRIKHAEIIHGFAERLRHLRRTRGLSQAELAASAQIHWTYIGRLEHGLAAPGLDLIERLALALNASIADLLPIKPVNATPFLQEQARSRMESIVQKADNDSLGILIAILTMMDESLARNP